MAFWSRNRECLHWSRRECEQAASVSSVQDRGIFEGVSRVDLLHWSWPRRPYRSTYKDSILCSAFAAYHQTTPWSRVAFLCCVAPLPCIALVILIDCVCLEPPSAGVNSMPRYWVRGTLVTLAITISNLEQFRHHKPQFALPHYTILTISILVAGVSVLYIFGLPHRFGSPLSFANQVGAPFWMVIHVAGLSFVLRRQLRARPALKKHLVEYFGFCLIQLGLPLIYPISHLDFSTLHSSAQPAFVLVLSLIKLAFKNGMDRALGDHDDLKPEALILNVEVFHALFMSYTMQNSSLFATIIVLVAVDFVHV